MDLIVYRLTDKRHVATITGATNAACERVAEDRYGSNDHGWTYTPASGAVDGITLSSTATIIDAESKDPAAVAMGRRGGLARVPKGPSSPEVQAKAQAARAVHGAEPA